MSNLARWEPKRSDIFMQVMATALSRKNAGYYVLSGCDVHSNTPMDMNVVVDAGTIVYNNSLYNIAGNTIALTSDPSNPKFYTIYLNTTTAIGHEGAAGTILPIGETEFRQMENPYPSDSTPEGVIIAVVYVPAGATTIADSNILDIEQYGSNLYSDSTTAYHNVIGTGIRILDTTDLTGAVEVYQQGTKVYCRDKDGTILDSGTLGTDDTDMFDTAVSNCPNNGIIKIGPGTYTLKTHTTPFYLSGDGTTNPFYYCIGIFDGKNVHMFGAGPDSTILKLANNQNYTDHNVVMILNRKTGDITSGHTGFTVANMTIDGNKANQTYVTNDGSGLILTGSTRSNEQYYNLHLKDSFNYGIYIGNNGSGTATSVKIHDIYITGCKSSGITTDTIKDATISDCLIIDSNRGIHILGNQPDYQSRLNDNILISNINCVKSGITLWTINGATVTDCTVDVTGASDVTGLQVHCSHNVTINNSKFKGNQTDQHPTLIDGGYSIDDGSYKNVVFRGCTFDGYYALYVSGYSKFDAYDCILHGYSTGACLYDVKLGTADLTCITNFYNCTFIAEDSATNLYKTDAGSTLSLNLCYAPNVGVYAASGTLYQHECYGLGFIGTGMISWMALPALTYKSNTDDPVFTVTCTGDYTTAIPNGSRIRLTHGGSVKYFILVKSSYANPSTTFYLYGGTDYELSDSAISYPYYSIAKAPIGFPLKPGKWTVTVTDSTHREKTSSITSDTWYNLDTSAQISVPIGVWKLSYMVYGSSSVTATPNWHNIRACLSSTSNGCSDQLSLREHLVLTDTATNLLGSGEFTSETTSKTTYYVNIQCSSDTTITKLIYYNELYAMIIKAECAYL